MPIIFDTGATYRITPFRQDIVKGWREEVTVVHGLDCKSKCIGSGQVTWTLRDSQGQLQTITILAMVMPTAEVRLFSPQQYLETSKLSSYTLMWETSILHL